MLGDKEALLFSKEPAQSTSGKPLIPYKCNVCHDNLKTGTSFLEALRHCCGPEHIEEWLKATTGDTSTKADIVEKMPDSWCGTKRRSPPGQISVGAIKSGRGPPSGAFGA